MKIEHPECCRLPRIRIHESKRYIYKKCFSCEMEVARRKDFMYFHGVKSNEDNSLSVFNHIV